MPKDATDEFRRGAQFILDELAGTPCSKDVFTLEDLKELQDMLYVKLNDFDPGGASANAYNDVIHGIGYVIDRLKAGLLHVGKEEK